MAQNDKELFINFFQKWNMLPYVAVSLLSLNLSEIKIETFLLIHLKREPLKGGGGQNDFQGTFLL